MSQKISRSNIPVKLPFFQTITIYLLLDKLDAAGWIWGVVGTIVVLWWILAIVALITSSETDIFIHLKGYKKKDVFSEGLDQLEASIERQKKSKFQQKLEDAIKVTTKVKEDNGDDNDR